MKSLRRQGPVEPYSLGDAGYILFGPIGREVLSAGTIVFAIFGAVRRTRFAVLALLTFCRALSFSPANRHCPRFLIMACAQFI